MIYTITKLFGVDSEEALPILSNKGLTPETFKSRAASIAGRFTSRAPRAVMLNAEGVFFLKTLPDGKVAACAGAPVEPIGYTWEKFLEANA